MQLIQAATSLQVVNTSTSILRFGRNDSSISAGNDLGVRFYGNAGGSYQQCAQIIAEFRDGTHANNDKPSRLVFATQLDGGSSSTERVRIDSSGNMGLGTSPTDHNSFTRIFDVNGSGGGAVYCRTNGSSSNVAIFGQSGSDVYIINKTAGNTRFNVSDAEKMRLDELRTTAPGHDD